MSRYANDMSSLSAPASGCRPQWSFTCRMRSPDPNVESDEMSPTRQFKEKLLWYDIGC